VGAGEGRRVRLAAGVTLQRAITLAESGIYLVVGALLVVAAAFTTIGTVKDVIEGSGSRPVTDTGVFVLERVLLIFIIAELLYTLRLLDFGGRILVEPFLLIGLIAVVRRILVITAEVEGKQGGHQITDFLVEIGVLGGLVLALAGAIFLLRASAARADDEMGLSRAAGPPR
jgi:uncharacterized membrane protein (DUF373 family)